ncbi:type VI secretion system baseplate subunit TssF [Pelagibius sp. Alg239-R121]|uniref:type VI secretion system baseplate subunit TssF n=1 Tax=Pelagibius sp. Alg239-R121 TaxID=2993448 RepID=UPI0024A61736|nr:type VI secretion system baseplate subunit TssF [Pelagibius sp. Alg239-R121]
MADELLPYYNRELTYVRKLAAEFADAHPKIAGRLRLSADAVEDPHVARLIEGFAYLTARIRHKIDDDFPELTDALIGALYPHYLAPIPSMSIVQFDCQADHTGSYEVPRQTEIETEPVGGESCRFTTCYDTTIWPIAVENASLSGRPLAAPANPRGSGAVAVLRLSLKCLTKEMTFTQLGPETLRFFLRGQPQQVLPLQELLFNNAVSIALADGVSDPNPVILGPDAIKQVGFERDEGVLPYPARSFVGYRLLTEYFAFPEKFLFFDLSGLESKVLLDAGNKLEVFIYLNRSSNDLERSVTAETFALGCTPMVNLFEQRAEPIALNQTSHEHRVVPDARREGVTEVFSIDSVTMSSPDGDTMDVAPFYSLKHSGDPRRDHRFWQAARRPAGQFDRGTEVYLSMVDLDYTPSMPANWTVSVGITGLNRDLPGKLPYGGGHPYLQLVEGASPVAKVNCLTAPTETLRPPAGPRGYWRLISHLSLNHLSITDAESGEGADALREILKLYDFRDSAETRGVIDSVLSVKNRRVAARAASLGVGGVCRGMEVEIEFDEKGFSGSGLFLLAQVLERFLGLYCSINSFTRLTARVKGRSGVLRKWPPRAGDRTLL